MKEKDVQSGKVSEASDDDDSHYISPTPPKKTAPKPKRPVVFNSDSEDEKPNGNGFAMNGDSDSEEEDMLRFLATFVCCIRNNLSDKLSTYKNMPH